MSGLQRLVRPAKALMHRLGLDRSALAPLAQHAAYASLIVGGAEIVPQIASERNEDPKLGFAVSVVMTGVASQLTSRLCLESRLLPADRNPKHMQPEAGQLCGRIGREISGSVKTANLAGVLTGLMIGAERQGVLTPILAATGHPRALIAAGIAASAGLTVASVQHVAKATLASRRLGEALGRSSPGQSESFGPAH